MKHRQGIPCGECPVSFLAEALVLHFIPVQPSTLFNYQATEPADRETAAIFPFPDKPLQPAHTS